MYTTCGLIANPTDCLLMANPTDCLLMANPTDCLLAAEDNGGPSHHNSQLLFFVLFCVFGVSACVSIDFR